MAEVIKMPRLSDTMEEGVVSQWLKKVGDKVSEGDILAEIETDKATMEFESFYDGTILHIAIGEGVAANVDSLLCIIGEEGEDISSLISTNSNLVEETSNSQLDLVDQIKKIVKEYDIDGIVIGNPINMDGTEGPSSQSAKDLAKNLSKDITENITLWDERLSSQGAFNLSNDLAINSSKKVKKLDENSAQFILQGILDYYHKKNT